MPAYATALRQAVILTDPAHADRLVGPLPDRDDGCRQRAVVDDLITAIAERIADAVAARIGQPASDVLPDWLDSRGAAEYLSLHPDTVRKLAAERATTGDARPGRGRSGTDLAFAV